MPRFIIRRILFIGALLSIDGCATLPPSPGPDWTLKKEPTYLAYRSYSHTRSFCKADGVSGITQLVALVLCPAHFVGETAFLPVLWTIDSLDSSHHTYTWLPPKYPRPNAPAKLSAEITFNEPSGNNVLDAGEAGSLDVRVTNSGAGPAYGVSLVVSVDDVSGLPTPDAMDLGQIEPGKVKTLHIALDATQKLSTGKAKVNIVINEANGFDASPLSVEFETLAFKAPKLEVSAVTFSGGVIRAGDVTQLEVTVKNSGFGGATRVGANLEILDKNIFPSGDIATVLGTLEPGGEAKIRFDFVVNMRFEGKDLPINLNLTESWGKYGVNIPLKLALGEPAPLPKILSVKARTSVPLQARSAGDALAANYQLQERPMDFAIVVGIDKYQTLPAADYSDRDATAMRTQLVAMGFPQRNIVFLTRDKATKSSFVSYVEEWLPRNVKPESNVFVYFSGHGAPDPKSGDAYLVPWDGKPEFLQSTAYSLRQLYAALGKLNVKEVTIALDACFSGAGGRSVLAKGARPLVPVNRERILFDNLSVYSAASGAEITGTLEEVKHGIFTYHFIKGMSGAAKDSSGKITAKGLIEYLVPRVQEDARRQNREQNPGLSGVTSRTLVQLEP